MAPPGFAPDWKTARLEEVGLQSKDLRQLTDAMVAKDYPGLHALLIIRNGRLAYEQYFPGKDERWGEKLSDVTHGPALLHDLRSVTKSIVGLLYGQALHDGLVPPTVARLAEALPGYGDLMADPLKRRITIGHVLSMRMGLDWFEDTDYENPRNGEYQMEKAADRYRYVLGLPMAVRPGAKWVYCGGATALLGHLIEQATGMRLEDYARERLFKPLGIVNFEWIQGSDGHAAASSGLRLTARDLARVGQMVLDHGFWHSRRIVPSSWIVTSMKPRAYADSGLRYGYQWWLGQLVSTAKPWFAAYGNGGQRLIIIPSLNMVVVILAGNYNMADQWKMPVKLMSKNVMPAVVAE
jgi:CubicO group peptidase (beta-lactamase class C family)